MNAPLSRFLVEFSRVPDPAPFTRPAALEPDDPDTDPVETAEADAFAQQLSDARDAEAEEARAETEARLTRRFEEERAELLRDFEVERETWAKDQGEALSASLAAAVAELTGLISDALASALRPLFAQALRARALAELETAVKALLGDPGHPMIRIEGPVDLLTAFGNTQTSDVAIDYVVADQAELTISADGTRIATRLSECLARIPISEG